MLSKADVHALRMLVVSRIAVAEAQEREWRKPGLDLGFALPADHPASWADAEKENVEFYTGLLQRLNAL